MLARGAHIVVLGGTLEMVVGVCRCLQVLCLWIIVCTCVRVCVAHVALGMCAGGTVQQPKSMVL